MSLIPKEDWNKYKKQCYICNYPIYLPKHPEGRFEFNKKKLDLCVICSKAISKFIEQVKKDFKVSDRLEEYIFKGSYGEYKKLKRKKLPYLKICMGI